MQVARHFTLLVYPFRHAISGSQRRVRLKKLNNRWRPWWRRIDSAGLKDALDDTYFLLPYIRKLLFPETTYLPAGDASQQVAVAQRLADLPVEQLAERLHPDGVLHLTYAPEELGALHPLRLEFERDSFSAPIRLSWVDIALFPQNVGFLVLKVQLDEENPSVNRLNDFLYYLRLVHPPSIDWYLANWKCVQAGAQLIFKSQDLVDFLLQGLSEGPGDPDLTLAAFLTRLDKNGSVWRYSTTDMGQVYGQTFRLYSYVCLAADASIGEPSRPTSETANWASPAFKESPSSLFASPAQQALYELATCSQITQPDSEPHPIGLAQLMEKAHIALWANWEGMALHDNVLFLGTRPSDFTLRSLAENVESDYFHLYLLTLYQKIRLSLLSGELMRQGADLHRNLREARVLWDAFMMFRNCSVAKISS